MDDFRLDVNELPPRLFRVICPNSTPYSMDEGFKARDQSPLDLTKWKNLRDALDSAYLESSGTPSPFVAVFSDPYHARDWALHQDRTLEKDVWVAEIDTSELGAITVLEFPTVVQELNVAVLLAIRADQRQDDVFLCVREIPATAILSVTSAYNFG